MDPRDVYRLSELLSDCQRRSHALSALPGLNLRAVPRRKEQFESFEEAVQNINKRIESLREVHAEAVSIVENFVPKYPES